MFIPHTRNSGLARELKDKETRLRELTGENVKIVERAGRKLENILTNKDPWKGRKLLFRGGWLGGWVVGWLAGWPVG